MIFLSNSTSNRELGATFHINLILIYACIKIAYLNAVYEFLEPMMILWYILHDTECIIKLSICLIKRPTIRMNGRLEL